MRPGRRSRSRSRSWVIFGHSSASGSHHPRLAAADSESPTVPVNALVVMLAHDHHDDRIIVEYSEFSAARQYDGAFIVVVL